MQHERESIERVVVTRISDCSKVAFLQQSLRYVYTMYGFTVSIDDVVELWSLVDMYHIIECLKVCCMGFLEMCEKNDVSWISKEFEEFSCPSSCDELELIFASRGLVTI